MEAVGGWGVGSGGTRSLHGRWMDGCSDNLCAKRPPGLEKVCKGGGTEENELGGLGLARLSSGFGLAAVSAFLQRRLANGFAEL